METVDDLHRHLANPPEDDDEFCQLLETSGLLLIWKIEKYKNPWQYDLNLLNALPLRM